MIGRMLGTALSCLWLSAAPGTAEPVRIGHSQVFPPFAEVKDGKSEGLAVDILGATAARAGIGRGRAELPGRSAHRRAALCRPGDRASHHVLAGVDGGRRAKSPKARAVGATGRRTCRDPCRRLMAADQRPLDGAVAHPVWR